MGGFDAQVVVVDGEVHVCEHSAPHALGSHIHTHLQQAYRTGTTPMFPIQYTTTPPHVLFVKPGYTHLVLKVHRPVC